MLKEWRPDLVVVGLPLNMDGTEQPVTAQAKSLLLGCTEGSAFKLLCTTSGYLRLRQNQGCSIAAAIGRWTKAA